MTNSVISHRFAALDLFRFLAALVVFFGHLVFFAAYGDNFKENYWLQPIRTGTFAVDFFFTLSGFVLSKKNPTIKWMISRVIRLYPVYFVGIFLGVFVSVASTGSLNTNTVGVFLGLFGLQSLVSQYLLVLNAPLWSLSVEIIVTPLFGIFFLMRRNRIFQLVGLMISIAGAIILGSSVILRSLPFFMLGSIVGDLKKPKTSEFFIISLVVLVILYISVGARFFSHLHYSLSDILIKLVVITILIYCLLGVKFSRAFSKVSSELGKRSYAIYAVHGPLIGISLVLWEPSEMLPFFGYVMTAFLLTAITSELVYRLVDLQAIQKASQTAISKS